MGSIGLGFGEWARVSLGRSRVRQVSPGAMCWARCGGVCASASLGTVCGVAVSGCRWPGQLRLPRDPKTAREYEGRIGCKCAAWPGGVKFAWPGPRLDGSGRCVRRYVSVVRALCCWGRGGAARGLVDRGVFLRKVVAARWSESRGRVRCRRYARVSFPGMSIVLVGCSWCGMRLLETAYEEAERLGAWPVENRNC